MTRRLQVSVDHSLCVSSHMCIGIAPGVFRAEDGGQAEVVDANAADADMVIEAGLGCPVSAIEVLDAESGEDLLD
jgi:ferredoxin